MNGACEPLCDQHNGSRTARGPKLPLHDDSWARMAAPSPRLTVKAGHRAGCKEGHCEDAYASGSH
jgi:hypothetical protein